MKRLLVAAVLILIAWVIWPRSRLQEMSAPAPDATGHATDLLRPGPQTTAEEELRELHGSILLMLTALKDPYRPPLGINEEFARALTGGNRRGDLFLATNHPALRGGHLIDPWGTPYHIHPRAPDAIDLRSAGPDRRLFTDDDLAISSGNKIVD